MKSCKKFSLVTVWPVRSCQIMTRTSFQNACKSVSMMCALIPSYHLRSNRLTGRFVDIFARVFRKTRWDDFEDRNMTKFLHANKIASNTFTLSRLHPEDMFSRKICFVFDMLLPCRKRKIKKKDIRTVERVTKSEWRRALEIL